MTGSSEWSECFHAVVFKAAFFALPPFLAPWRRSPGGDARNPTAEHSHSAFSAVRTGVSGLFGHGFFQRRNPRLQGDIATYDFRSPSDDTDPPHAGAPRAGDDRKFKETCHV